MHWKKACVILSLGALGLVTEAFACGYNEYRNAANEITKAVEGKQLPADFNTKIDSMVKIATCYVTEYQKLKSECQLISQTALDGVASMKTGSREDVEAKYHDGAIYEGKVDVNDPKYNHCLEMTHIIIQPMMALKAAEAYLKDKKPADLEAVKAEMIEALEHLEEAKKGTGK